MPLPEMPKDDWFSDRPHNPLDDMPIATNDRFDMYGSSDADDAYNPRPEEEIADAYASRHEYTPEFEKSAKEIGSRELPDQIKFGMNFFSKIMKNISYRI